MVYMTKPKLKKHAGNDKDATTWVQSSNLSEKDKVDLLEFIQRFSSQTFFREDDELLDALELTHNVKLPLWVREMRKTLAGLDPSVQIRFSDYDHWLPRSDEVADAWYALKLGYNDDEERALILDQAGCFSIGAWVGNDYSYLAINMQSDNDQQILEFALSDLSDNIAEGTPARASVRVAFDSYPRMLWRIAQARLSDGRLVDPSS
jgi:hypothetical protein